MRYAPRDYQKGAIEFGVERGAAGLFLAPGLGKTSIMYAVYLLLKRRRLVNKMLVIAPLRPAYQVWPAEAQKWDQFSHLKVAVLHGPKKEEALRSDADVYVINPEGLPWFFRQKHRTSARQPWPFDMLVVDESTRFKHTNTDRFRTLKPWLKEFKRRFILTGSPAPNGLLDLFGQVFILDHGHALGDYLTHYRMQYFDQTGYGGYTYVPKLGAAEQIYAKLKPLVLRLDEKELLEMPPLIGTDPPLRVDVELPPKAMRAYRQMEDDLIAAVENDTIVAANSGAATMKCRQIANGGIYHQGGEKWSHIHEVKVDAVEEIIEALQGKPALVAYEFKHDLERLRQRFPSAPWIGGGVSAAKFRDIERSWNQGDIPVLLAQPQSVAHGLNLQGTGAAVIFHSLIWDLEIYEQFIRRVWRQGQKEKVIVHHVTALGTVDEVSLRGVAKKDRTEEALLAALKDYAGERRAA